MTILYIDDDVEDIEIFRDAIQVVDVFIDFTSVNSAREALSYLRNGTNLPDHIFLDINMPGMDGKMCLQEIRKDTAFDGIAVTIFSTNSFPGDIEYVESLGAKFMRKATSFSELCDIVRSLKDGQ
ncbi:MAG: response regulator [Cyclobacteriaceae bacterium]